MCCLAVSGRISCQDTSPIPALHVFAELIPTRTCLTRACLSGCSCLWFVKIGIDQTHLALLLGWDMVIKVDVFCREVGVVVNGNWIGGVAVPARVTMGSHNSCCISNPFKWPPQKIQFPEPADGEVETFEAF